MARLDYFAPGIYVEEIDQGSRPIDGVQTNVGGFIGFTEALRNGAKLGEPMLVTSWNQYLEYFAKEGSDGFTSFDAYLPFAVQGWFMNGGARCYVISIGTRLPGVINPSEAEQEAERDGTKINTSGRRPSMLVTLKDEQSEPVVVVIEKGKPKDIDTSNPDIDIPIEDEFFTLKILSHENPNPRHPLETFEHLSMNPEVPEDWGHNAITAVNQGIDSEIRASRYVTLTDLFERDFQRRLSEVGTIRSPGGLSRRPMNGGYEVRPVIEEYSRNRLYGKTIGDADQRLGIKGSFEIDDITMLAFPDLMRAYEAKIGEGDTRLLELHQVHGIMEHMLSLCEAANPNPPNRMIVLDPPPDKKKPQEVARWLSEEFGRRSMYGALYYPWIQVPNPRNEGKPILVPPCGHMMGIWSRTDETRGVHKAPANETPRGVIGLAYDCNYREQELLNPIGINCIRTFPNRGIKVWGARTLVEPEKTDWRYISVRRLISYIERSIELGTQWVVFEPNDQDLWARVERTISNFLERIWRDGALFGATPEQAFFVKCDATINPPETMILGRLYVEVGICPVRPAEFVIFRISQFNSQDGN